MSSRRRDRTVTVTVKTLLTGKPTEFRVRNSSTVADVKAKVMDAEGVLPMMQRLSYGGQELPNASRLYELEIPAPYAFDLVIVERAPTLLIVVLDALPQCWGADTAMTDTAAERMSFVSAARATLVLVNSFLTLSRRNRVAIIANSAQGGVFIHPSDAHGADSTAASSADPGAVCAFSLEGLAALLDKAAGEARHPGGNMASCLSLGLCYYNRLKAAQPSLSGRVLVLNASPDVGAQYVATMNCIFSAHKVKVPIDTCALGAEESYFLQQAAHITGGRYYAPPPELHASVVQVLLTLFLTPKAVSDEHVLRELPQSNVDMRASCFCHKRLVDTAYVCSVCLSIFCEKSPVCSTCGTRRPDPAKARRAATGSGTAAGAGGGAGAGAGKAGSSQAASGELRA